MSSKIPAAIGALLLCLSNAQAQPAPSAPPQEPSACPPGPRIIHVLPPGSAPTEPQPESPPALQERAQAPQQPSPAEPQASAPRAPEPSAKPEKDDALARFMGLRLQDMTSEIAEATGSLVDSGALVARVVRRTPASRANLRRGDVIIGLQGEPVSNVGEFLDRVAKLPPGAPITVQYVRAGITATAGPLALTASGLREAQAARARPTPGERALGIALGAPPPEAGGRGAEVVEVAEGSRAEKSGLKEGDVIVEVNRQPISSPEQLALLAQQDPTTPLLLQVQRGQEALFLLVPPLA